MGQAKTQYVVPFLIIAIGIGWLLNALSVIGTIDWVWTVGLAAVGVATLFAGELNKLTFVVGGFLLIGSICSILRQSGRLSVDAEVPILVILLGVLMLVAQLIGLPGPKVPDDNRPAAPSP